MAATTAGQVRLDPTGWAGSARGIRYAVRAPVLAGDVDPAIRATVNRAVADDLTQDRLLVPPGDRTVRLHATAPQKDRDLDATVRAGDDRTGFVVQRFVPGLVGPRYVSFVDRVDWYGAGGAHPNQAFFGHTFDLVDGSEVDVAALIVNGGNAIRAAAAAVRAQSPCPGEVALTLPDDAAVAGPMLTVEAPGASASTLVELLRRISALLPGPPRTGADDRLVRPDPPELLDELAGPVPVLELRAVPRGDVDAWGPRLLAAALGWAAAGGWPVVSSVVAAEFPVDDPAAGTAFGLGVLRGGRRCQFARRGADGLVRAAALVTAPVTDTVFGIGGRPLADPAVRAAAWRALLDLGRGLADAVHSALATPAPDWVALTTAGTPVERRQLPALDQVVRLPDDLVLDAGPWQLLGPDHLTRLPRRPPAGPSVGRLREVAFGTLADWWPDEQQEPEDGPAALERARAALAGAFLTLDEADELLRDRGA